MKTQNKVEGSSGDAGTNAWYLLHRHTRQCEESNRDTREFVISADYNRIRMKKIWLSCFLASCILTHAQRDYKNPAIDVLHYTFNLQLNDENNNIKAAAIIAIKFLEAKASFDLDMVKKNSNGKGMTVTAVKENNNHVSFLQEAETIHIYTKAKAGDTINYTIAYEGIPADGLIIDKNKYGHRTFFGDNWPNRAHNWLPCIDDPSDKASVDFIVTAPEHYQ